jgi:uncharacterized membrane protein
VSIIKDLLQGKWLKHPLHPVIVHMPTGLWPSALVFDFFSIFGIGGNALVRTSFYAISFGLLATVLAVPTGLADWWDIKRDRPAWKLGLYHMILNLIVSLLWAINLALRLRAGMDLSRVPVFPFTLSILSTLLLFVSGYLGGRMVYDYGISVARLSKEKFRQAAHSGDARVPSE